MASHLGLDVAICDGDPVAATVLAEAIGRVRPSAKVTQIFSIAAAERRLDPEVPTAIFIDLLTLGLDAAAVFVLKTREQCPNFPIVIYADLSEVERNRADFYRGERYRFGHYYRLDKRTPVQAFDREVDSLLTLCASYLAWNTLRRPVESRRTGSQARPGEALPLSPSLAVPTLGDRNTVFLSHRFAETEYVEDLQRLLTDSGFIVVKGDSANTFVSRAVLERIRACEYFLCLMTRAEEKVDGTYVTSSWLLEEKGAALAFGKPLVMMVEDGVSDFGGLQGDWQRIHFTSKGFLKAALQAVDQLRSYSGKGDPQ